MMKKLTVATIAAVGVVVLFAAIPAEKVQKTAIAEAKFKNWHDQKMAKFDWNAFDNAKEVERSGLRMAIVGRLKWLGIGSEWSIPLKCREEGGEVICPYILVL